ncbi:MAG TPA: indole-3-glycerol-phosphate synthase [Candidatus Bathyarchaeia archaeon]|nr:indole-3-glycerol-phosphate synthase [Candidatus Bathyarchaeia archaeon]
MPDFFDILCRTAHNTVAGGYYSGFAERDKPVNTVPTLRLSKCIRRCAYLPLIAEIKLASPTMGAAHVDAGAIARHMQAGGAVGISVVTEPRFFKGSSQMLGTVRSTVSVPLIMKDFIVSACQIEAARDAGASAILLIQTLFDRGYATRGADDMIEFAHAVGLEVLLEAHTDSELERALSTDADLVGINNRDLRTLTVDIMTTKDILEKVRADGRIVVSESGVETPEEALFLKRCGADALLVGSALMRAVDVRRAVNRLVSAA